MKFTENVSREMAVAGWEAALELAREKGPAPIMNEEFTVTARNAAQASGDGEATAGGRAPRFAGRVLHARYSRYMQRVAEAAPQLVDELAEVGARFTHHTSIAPTGTISLSLANNASNGIEPSFAHHYFRNVIREGKKTKEKVDVFSFELLAYRELVNPRAMPGSTRCRPRSCPTTSRPRTTVDAEAARGHPGGGAEVGRLLDLQDGERAHRLQVRGFQGHLPVRHEQGLKGCTTFRFNPEAFQGVLVKEEDLKNTTYVFTLEDGTEVEVTRRRGDRVRRREAHRRESVRCLEGRLLREVLIMAHIKIDKKIVKYRVHKPEDKRRRRRRRCREGAAHSRNGRTAKVIRMHEEIQRPEVLIGSTYKIKTPVSDHAMYVTINDIVLNEGTEHEQRRPFEVFINSKNLDHFQWIVALTRIISAVFRKGGDVTFLVDELKAVFDPRGGYWQPGGKFMPSIIAELGYVIEKHLQTIGLLRKAGAR